MRALVLGGNRYIGLSLVFELARQGHEVTVANSHEAALPAGAGRIHVDRRVPGALVEALSPWKDQFDIVFDNTAYVVDDVAPLVELFSGRLDQYVFTSSVAVYRRSEIQPIWETFPVYEGPPEPPARAYAAGKVATERYLRSQYEATGFPATSARVTHTIGPRSALGAREPSFFARLEQGRPILIPGDGFPFVHLIHVDDVARMLAAVSGVTAARGEIYNCAGAEVATVAGCMRLMAKVMGVEARLLPVPLEVARSYHPPLVHWNEAFAGGAVFSIDKAKADLDWTPALGLEDAYRDSWEWYNNEGRHWYDFDWSRDDEILARL